MPKDTFGVKPKITVRPATENWRRCSCCYKEKGLSVIHFTMETNPKHSTSTVVTLCPSCKDKLREELE